MFKVGDKVRIRYGQKSSFYDIGGKTGVILKNYKGEYLVQIDDFNAGFGVNRDLQHIHPADLIELKYDEVPIPEPTGLTQVYKKDYKVYQDEDTGITAVILENENGSFAGFSKCNKTDKFNSEFGKRLALSRAVRKVQQAYEKRLLEWSKNNE